MKLNYFSNYMLKHHSSQYNAMMLQHQDEYLALLQQGKKITLDSFDGLHIIMRAGKIVTVQDWRE